MTSLINELGTLATRTGTLMFWQSALLGFVILAIELVAGRRLRATLRCALWLLVIAKLLLPPSLMVPTSVAYWLGPWLLAPLHERQTPLLASSPAQSAEVSSPRLNSTFTAPLKSGRPEQVSAQLTLRGAFGLIWMAGTFSLVGLIARRHRDVHRLLQNSRPASAQHQEALAEASANVGLTRLPKFRITEAAHSPAVCGLLNPVIILPRKLAETLSPAALRDVLLHELVHIQRRDLWFSVPQLLALVVWWWNPCVWLANARIRSLREQAVDQRVLTVPGGNPASYAATLVEVARYCVTQPTMALHFVGILESRRALRTRVENLLSSSLPRQADLGGSGWVAVILVALLMVPMAFARRVEPEPVNQPSPQASHVQNVPGLSADEPRQRILAKLESIVLPELDLEGKTLGEVVAYLEEQSLALSPDKVGLNFIILEPTEHDGAAVSGPLSDLTFRGPKRTNLRLREALVAMVDSAQGPLAYAVESYATVFSVPPKATVEVHTRRFNLDGEALRDWMEARQFTGPWAVRSWGTEPIQDLVRELFRQLDVSYPDPKSGAEFSWKNPRAVYFNDQRGILFVRATLPELDRLEQAITALSPSQPLFRIEAAYIEEESAVLDSLLSPLGISRDASTGSVNLSRTQVEALFDEVEKRKTGTIRRFRGQAYQGRRPLQISMPGGTGRVGSTPHGPLLEVVPELTSKSNPLPIALQGRLHRFALSPGGAEPAYQVRTQEFAVELPTAEGSTAMLFDPPDQHGRQILFFLTPFIVDPAQ